MFSSWELKLLLDVCIMSQKCKALNIIKQINEDLYYFFYLNSSNIEKIKYDGDGYSLSCNDVTSNAMKEGDFIIKNG